MQTIWEFLGDPDPTARRAVAARRRRNGWLAVAVLASATGIPAVAAFGVWGLVYPAIFIVAVGGVTELYAVLTNATQPDQRVRYDGAHLHIDGDVELIGQPREPLALDAIVALAVYPAMGGFQPHATHTRATFTCVDLWLQGGARRVIAFQPRGLSWRSADHPLGWNALHATTLAAALDALMPGRWRDPPAADERAVSFTIDEVQLRRWGSYLPPSG